MQSLHSVRSRPAEIGVELMTRYFGSTLGFAAYDNLDTAVSVSPDTKLTFIQDIRFQSTGLIHPTTTLYPQSATFRRIKPEQSAALEDVLEFCDVLVPLKNLCEGQSVWVSQMPAV